MTDIYAAASLAKRIRGNGATTCCCHVMVDDPNFDDSTAKFCYDFALERGHPDCQRLAGMLIEASKTQRRRINYLAWA